MTLREPDRFEAKAREATDRCLDRDGDKPAGFACVECIAAALRAEARDTRQDAIDVIRSHVAAPLAAVMVRALIPPAAAPAAHEPERFFPGAAELMGEPPAPAAETNTCPHCGGDIDHGRNCAGEPAPAAEMCPTCGSRNRAAQFDCPDPWHAAPAAGTGKAQGAEALDGAALITAERKRQVEKEGWTPEHDDEHTDGALASAAVCYAIYGHKKHPPSLWPWDKEWWRPGMDPIRRLVKAGALVAAEIDRLHREAEAKAWLAARAAPPEGEGT